MTEPDVALTDFALCVETAWFAWGLAPRRHAAARAGTVLFAALSAASLIGGTVHGFASDESTLAYSVLWRCTLLCMGVVAAGLAGVATALLQRDSKRWLGAALVVYAGVVLLINQSFFLAIAAYVPAALLLLGVLVRQGWHTRGRAEAFGALAMVLTFVASTLQQLHIGVHPVYFNHNALYHLIEAVALALLYACLRLLTRETSP